MEDIGWFSPSADGNTAVYTSMRDPGPLYRVNRDDSRRETLVAKDVAAAIYLRGAASHNAGWGPNGQSIAYVNGADQRPLWALPLDGGPSYPLTKLKDPMIWEFGWSPDGKRLITARGRYYDDAIMLKGLSN